MQYAYNIFPAKRLIVQRYVGRVTVPEIRGVTEQLWADPRYSPAYDVLSDLSSAFVLTVSPSEAKRYGEFIAENPKATVGRVAAILSTPLETALALIFQRIVRIRTPVKIFSTWEGACAYLDVKVERSEMPA